ncbi:MAG: hypothetical protein AB7F75_10445 [Planctomycetota bacterium]
MSPTRTYTPDQETQEWIESFIALPAVAEFDQRCEEAGAHAGEFREWVLGQLEEKGSLTFAFMALSDLGELSRARRFYLRHKRAFLELPFPVALVVGKRVRSTLPELAMEILKPHNFDLDHPYAGLGIDVDWLMRRFAGHLRQVS